MENLKGVAEVDISLLAHLLLCHAGFYCFLVTQISQMTQIFRPVRSWADNPVEGILFFRFLCFNGVSPWP